MQVLLALSQASVSPWQLVSALAVGLVGLCILLSLLPKKRKSVAGQLVVITGAGSGLGRLFAKRFLNLGAKVAALDINLDGVKTTVEEAKREYEHKYGKPPAEDSIKAYSLDVTSRAACFEVLGRIEKEMGCVYLLLNNAGIVVGKLVEDLTEQDVRRTMDVNCLGSVWTTQAVLPGMIKRRSGHLAYLASSAGTVGVPMLTDYCASKAAQNMFADAVREELRCRDKFSLKGCIPVTVINPYFIATGMFAGIKDHPLAKVLEPAYVVDASVDAILQEKELISMPFIVAKAPWLRETLPPWARTGFIDLMKMTDVVLQGMARGKEGKGH